jgi:hypothetical protein
MLMQIVRAKQSAFLPLWQRLRAEGLPRSALYTPLDRKYLTNYPQPWEALDCSFVIADEAMPLAGAMMALKPLADGGVELSAFGRPIYYLERPELKLLRTGSLYSLVKEELDRVRANDPIRAILYQNPAGPLTVLGRYLLDEGARPVPAFAQVLDLLHDEKALRQMVRKSYKSLINWGERNLTPLVVDSDNLTEGDFDAYRQLHLLAAGRETRSRATWCINWEMIRAREAFLVLGRLVGRLVTGAYFNVFGDACYYSNAASDRSLFEKPLGHCIIWRGLLHARALGCRTLEMGEIFFPNQPHSSLSGAKVAHGVGSPDEKNLRIATFKRGFGGRTESRLNIVWGEQS